MAEPACLVWDRTLSARVQLGSTEQDAPAQSAANLTPSESAAAQSAAWTTEQQEPELAAAAKPAERMFLAFAQAVAAARQVAQAAVWMRAQRLVLMPREPVPLGSKEVRTSS